MVFSIILVLLLTAISIYLLALIRSFGSMRLGELKRQARAGNALAEKVFPIRSHGLRLWIFLWLLTALISLWAVCLAASTLGIFWTLLIAVPIVTVVHTVGPRQQHSGLYLAATASPVLEKILRYLFPILRRIESVLLKYASIDPIQDVHSKDELLELLADSTKHFDHVGKAELEIAANAVTYGELLVMDYMTPLNTVTFISSEEQLTPVVLGELHKSGHSRFPVYQGSNQHIVGTLFLKDALRVKNPKPASTIMRPEVFYINEQSYLDYALGAFIKTKHHLFVVVNEFEDVVGVITIEDILEQILGTPILDEFDQYDDLRAVAHKHAADKRKAAEGEHV